MRAGTAHPESARKRRWSLWIGVGLFTLILLCPRPAGLSPAAQRVAATVVLMACWWIGEAVPLAATALLPLSVFPLLGVASVQSVAASYGNHLIFLFLGGFLLAAAIQKCGLHQRLAYAVLRVLGGRPSRIVGGFMLATAGLSMWISNTATTLLMYPIGMAVVESLIGALPGEIAPERRQEYRRSFGLMVMLGVAYAASIGGVATLIGTPPNVILAGQYQKLFPDAPPLTFASWMRMALPIAAATLPVAWWYLTRYAAPCSCRKLDLVLGRPASTLNRELESQPWTRAEVVVLVAFTTTALLWILRSDIDLGIWRIPGWSRVLPDPALVTDATVAITISLLLFAIPADREPGHRVLDWQHAKDLPWGVLILFGGGFALAEAMTASGLSQFAAAHLSLLDGLPLPLVVGASCLLVVTLTEVTSNTAVAAILLPLLAALAVRQHAPPLLVMLPATIAASFAFVLPVATPPNAIVMGSGWVRIGEMARAGIVLDLIGVGIILAAVFGFGSVLL